MSLRNLLFGTWKSKSLWRILSEEKLYQIEFRGEIFNLGSGRKNPHLKGRGTLRNLDLKGTERESPINLETDPLPSLNESVDFIIMQNLLEHIYNHKFLVNECFRVLKKGGTLVGSVPFFCYYHPGPKDFFRYTKEALEKIFLEAGFPRESIKIGIEPLGFGPFSVAYNIIFLSLKRFSLLKPIFVLCLFIAIGFDKVLFPHQKDIYPLGFFFKIKKI